MIPRYIAAIMASYHQYSPTAPPPSMSWSVGGGSECNGGSGDDDDSAIVRMAAAAADGWDSRESESFCSSSNGRSHHPWAIHGGSQAMDGTAFETSGEVPQTQPMADAAIVSSGSGGGGTMHGCGSQSGIRQRYDDEEEEDGEEDDARSDAEDSHEHAADDRSREHRVNTAPGTRRRRRRSGPMFLNGGYDYDSDYDDDASTGSRTSAASTGTSITATFDSAARPAETNISTEAPPMYSPADVIRRIEDVCSELLSSLDQKDEPVLATPQSVLDGSTSSLSSSQLGSASASASASASVPASHEVDEEGVYLHLGLGHSNKNNRTSSATCTNTNGHSMNATTQAPIVTKHLHLHQCRSYTSTILVLSYIHTLLRSNRTTTTREVYYHYVTHFRSQRECDAAILDCANLLKVPRVALGLVASPKGWFCGCLEIVRRDMDGENGEEEQQLTGDGTSSSASDRVVDGTALSSVQGLPITREWIDRSTMVPMGTASFQSQCQHQSLPFDVRTKDARCILIIEKEGVYNRLSEDRFYDRYPCILVTGKGYPDLATRALVHALHTELQLPVLGLCDCNPYGMSVLQTYVRGSVRMGLDGADRYAVPMQWVGLRPSQVESLREELPPNVYQSLTDLDRKKIVRLGESSSPFLGAGVTGRGMSRRKRELRRKELQLMARTGVKVELESLHWLGMDYMCNWLEKIVTKYDKQQRSEEVDHNEDSEEEEEDDDGSYASNDRTAHDDEFSHDCSDDEYVEGDFPDSMPVI